MRIASANHYLPCSYLGRFTHEGKLQVYRTLVESEKVPLWKTLTPRAIAYHQHLYTDVSSGEESDRLEKWFGREIESPAQAVIDKAVRGSSMSRAEWQHLIRFFAAQDVRTPTYLRKCLEAWNHMIPETLGRSMQDLKVQLSSPFVEYPNDTVDKREDWQSSFRIPMRIDRQDCSDGTTKLRVAMLAGRGLWLNEIDRMLNETWQVLASHRWSILESPAGATFCTSDNPAIKLNFTSPVHYNFGGGWNSIGIELMLPISPNHLLYAKIGSKPPGRNTPISAEAANWVKRLIVENASRFIYSADVDVDIPKLRKRAINPVLCNDEKSTWHTFHQVQTDAELEMLTRPSRKL